MCFVSFSRWHYINLFFFFFFEKPALYKPIYNTCKCVLFIIFLFLISSSHPPQPKGVPKRCAKKEKERKKSLSLSLKMNGWLKATAHLTNTWHSANIWHISNVSKDSKSHILPEMCQKTQKVIFCHNSKLYGAVYFISYKFKFRYQHLYHMIIDCKAKYGHVRDWNISSYPTQKKNLPSFS